MKKVIAGAVLSVLSLSLPALAAAPEKFQFRGENASASFYRYDGCSSSSISVYAFTNRTKDGPGAPTEQMGADLYYYNYNYCNGTYSSGYGSSPNANFTIDNKLNSASLAGTFSVYDYSSGTNKTVDVKVNWTGTDDYSSNSKSHYTYQTPTSITRYSSRGDFRQAQVSGSAILDGTDLIANTSDSYGYLNSSKSGSYVRTTR
jgi:hypothetical protein